MITLSVQVSVTDHHANRRSPRSRSRGTSVQRDARDGGRRLTSVPRSNLLRRSGRDVRDGWSFGFVPRQETVEALRPVDLSLGARHHLTGGEYVVTESEPGRAVLTPVDVARLFQIPERLLGPPKPIRRSWWKPNTWRRNG